MKTILRSSLRQLVQMLVPLIVSG